MHALGLQTTGAWLIFSQGFVVAAAMRSTTLCCGSYLADALHQVLSTHGGGWAASLLASTDQSRLCLAYASGMQIGVGYVGVVLVGLLAEWRQRMAFAAKHQLPPPAMIDLFALNGTLLSMLFFRRGFRCYVLPVERKDWFKVARALLTLAYWRGASTTHPGYSWYLERVAELVDQARRETGSEQVDLVAHSAGGWLARAFIGQGEYRQGGANASEDTLGSAELEPHPAVRALVTLGTPHTPPPPDKVKDMTGGALTWVDATWPGACFAGQGVRYVAVAGRAVRGDRDADRRTLSGYAAGSYQQVCGEGHETEGDAVVPLRSALLEGADHVMLDGVFHSMSRVRTFNEPSGLPWYGDERVLDAWLHTLVRP
ncbi:GPI inositol-deacylase PGAP1-like [Micractinium conductrix]|uniref:GPI inositol-deacylase PGAP1-like n=1 Tax=Micractinium conductrix TaxID=554055 RepID=A0A2P6V2W6_9CHLO|nr:GPI inositol-deacylase PGAP1-like [Micractinium conductrix]|eukprot:PSC68432.1 GPI inositol-deacylase PGAP1-like [Micractinium conductrix]